MNILVDELPKIVIVGDTEYALKTDFRYALMTILAFEDQDLSNNEKASIMLQNTFDEIPRDLQQAVVKCQWFLNAGETTEDRHEGPRLYSFEHDAQLIYAAFVQTHKIDLQNANIHWWQFLSLFMDLGKDTTFCNLVALRSRYIKGKLTSEERHAIRDMKNFHLPDARTISLEEREERNEFMERYKQAKIEREKRKSEQ